MWPFTHKNLTHFHKIKRRLITSHFQDILTLDDSLYNATDVLCCSVFFSLTICHTVTFEDTEKLKIVLEV